MGSPWSGCICCNSSKTPHITVWKCSVHLCKDLSSAIVPKSHNFNWCKSNNARGSSRLQGMLQSPLGKTATLKWVMDLKCIYLGTSNSFGSMCGSASSCDCTKCCQMCWTHKFLVKNAPDGSKVWWWNRKEAKWKLENQAFDRTVILNPEEEAYSL